VRYGYGFTLIELIASMIILAVIAVVAAPKYLSLEHEAQAAKVVATRGAMASAAEMVHMKAAVVNKLESASDSIQLENNSISLAYGYPASWSGGVYDGIIEATDMGQVGFYGASANNTDNLWVIQLGSTGGGASLRRYLDFAPGVVVGDGPGASTPISTKCYIRYLEATPNQPFSIESDNSGC